MSEKRYEIEVVSFNALGEHLKWSSLNTLCICVCRVSQTQEAKESKKNRFILTWINVNEIEDFFSSPFMLVFCDCVSECVYAVVVVVDDGASVDNRRVVFIIRQFSSTFRLSVILPQHSIVSCFCPNVCDLCTKQFSIFMYRLCVRQEKTTRKYLNVNKTFASLMESYFPWSKPNRIIFWFLRRPFVGRTHTYSECRHKIMDWRDWRRWTAHVAKTILKHICVWIANKIDSPFGWVHRMPNRWSQLPNGTNTMQTTHTHTYTSSSQFCTHVSYDV